MLCYIIIVPMITMNLFIAVVLQGYDMSLRENEAELKPSDLNEFVEKWSEYDPTGSGFISPQNFAFLLYELRPPIGLRQGVMQQQFH